jgi:hypothetical protein
MCGLFRFFVGIRPELVGAGSLYCSVLAVRVRASERLID